MQDAIVPGDADSPLPNLGETAFSDGSAHRAVRLG
jgi:hypothetical protein